MRSLSNSPEKSLQKPKAFVIVGPTASGKSDLAIQLAKKFNGEIISADSRQVYRGMNIGTGKVPRDRIKNNEFGIRNSKNLPCIIIQRTLNYDTWYRDMTLFMIPDSYLSNNVAHYLLDVASPKRDFSVARYKKLAEKALRDILKRGKIPIIVGGTGFYIDALLGRTGIPEVPPNKKLRAQLDKLTAEKLFEKLRRLDPARAATIDRHNKRRLVRALEIVLSTGRPVPSFSSSTPENIPFLHDRVKMGYSELDTFWLGMAVPRKKLEEKIKNRLEKDFKHGLIKEVQRLHKDGLSWKRLYNFGLEYRWVAEYLQHRISRHEMKKGLTRATVQYAKRQMTWFKRNKDIHWIATPAQAQRLVKSFLA